MRRLLLLAFAILVAVPLFAQTEKGYIYLNNGTILKGKYRYSTDRQKLNIESGGNLWVFDVSEVDSITSLRAYRLKTSGETVSDSRTFYRAEIGVLAGNSENSQEAPFSCTGSANYLFNSKMSAGLGFGVEFLKESYLPVYANFEYKIKNSSSTPFVFVKAGYQVAIEDSRTVYYDVYPVWASYVPWPNQTENENLKAAGGMLFNTGVGYQRMFSSGFGMSFSFGYQFHRLQYKGEKDYQLDIDYNRLSVKLGILFN